MNKGLTTVELNTGELVIAKAKNLDPALYPKNKIRKLSIIDRIPDKSVARIAEFSDEESLVQLRDLLLELFPLDYKAYDEAEIADPNGTLAAEMRALGELVHGFAAAMRHKLYAKAVEGYTGWNDHENVEMIRQKLLANAERGDWVDVANLSAMLWSLEHSQAEEPRQESEDKPRSGLTLSEALKHLRTGKEIRRKGWAVRISSIEAQTGIYWRLTLEDLLADDWEVVEP